MSVLTITTAKSGALTEVSLAGAAADIVAVWEAARVARFSRPADGATSARFSCSKGDFHKVADLVAGLNARRASAAPAPQAAPDPTRTWDRRVMVGTGRTFNQTAEQQAPARIVDHGREFVRTGFGQEFLCTSETAQPWFQGEYVRYAYYRAALGQRPALAVIEGGRG